MRENKISVVEKEINYLIIQDFEQMVDKWFHRGNDFTILFPHNINYIKIVQKKIHFSKSCIKVCLEENLRKTSNEIYCKEDHFCII